LACKRALDVTVALLLLVALLPFLLLVSLLIKLQDGGPVLFSQTRVGKGGRHFKFYKFRSMAADAEARLAAVRAEHGSEDSLRFKLERDPRITTLGRLIRKLSIDELPQLLNVLRGDMSLVGPRPPVPAEVAEYDAYERRRLSVEQGLTCLWQVSGRSLLSFEDQVELDLRYIRERSFWTDLTLLVLTVPAVVSGKGAY
jgi:lipopolysaccharide/colanic/teichoic acid biosynthesis glycosyltransferase